MPGSNRMRNASYAYTKLSDAQSNSEVHVYAVVKFVKLPSKSRGTDYSQVMSIIDPTFNGQNKLKCLFFWKQEASFPPCQVGSIVRFHRLKIRTHNDHLQGSNGPGFSWLVFDGDIDGSTDPVAASSDNFTLNATDKDKLCEIREWMATVDVESSQIEDTDMKKLSDAVSRNYLDVICQVVGKTLIPPENCVVLHVWDGTKTASSVRLMDLTNATQSTIDKNLLKCAKNFVYDIAVYDDHQASTNDINPRDMVKFTNLHMMECKQNPAALTDGTQPPQELVIHRGGTHFGRGVCKCDPAAFECRAVTARLDTIRDLQTSNVDDKDVPVPDTSQRLDPLSINTQLSQSVPGPPADSHSPNSQVVSSSCNSCDIPADNTSADDTQADDTQADDMQTDQRIGEDFYDYDKFRTIIEKFECPVSENDRCLMRTQTVVTHNHSLKSTIFDDIIKSAVPDKYRVQCYLLDYSPRSSDPRMAIKLYCSHCRYLCEVPEDKPSQRSELCVYKTIRGCSFYECPRCMALLASTSNSQPSQVTPNYGKLVYMYLFEFILIDRSGWIVANLWNEQARTFFSGDPPESMFQDNRKFSHLLESLDRLCVSNDKTRDDCLLECCLHSFMSRGDVNFELFDTKLVSSE